jgi:predicted esterase
VSTSTLLVETRTHGRVIVKPSAAANSSGLLVGFHGYAETAEIQMNRLEAIPGADAWTLLSVQGLHRFYRGRSQEVVASWMTREDRETAIADNLTYVDAAIAASRITQSGGPIVYAGFSQGVAMAFRAAVLGSRACAGVIAVCGDVPPELLADQKQRFPAVLLLRGSRDEWYTEARSNADVASLRSRTENLMPLAFDGGHEWGPDVSGHAAAFLTSLQRA